jgi:septal ring factor EnvC (AmiA/AmiB activator)
VKRVSLAFCLLFIICPLFANDLARVEAQIEQARRQDAAVAGQIRDNERVVARTQRELVKTAGELSKLESQKRSVEDRIKDLEKRQAVLAKRVQEHNTNLAAAAAGLVTIGMAPPSFDESRAGDYVLTMALLVGVSERLDAEIKIALSEIRELERLQAELERQRGTFAEYQRRTRRQQQELDKLLRVRSEQNQALRGQQYELQRRLGDLSARARNLSELADRVAPSAAAAPVSAPRGRMRIPVSGMLLLRFGQLNAAEMRSDGWRVRTNPNALVVAPADGRIEFADHFRRYRHIVIINHKNGYMTVLTGMSGLDVLIGQEVLAGEPIGRMPDSNPELYMELRRNNRAVDPARMFNEPR